MTSEIRANTLKNRVGLGTVSFTNTGPIVSGIITANSFSGTLTSNGDITGTGDLTLTSTDAGSSASPIINLFRNSASPADADYLGQIKFQGESSTGVQRNYAKITGKILDVTNGSEDGILEFAHIKGGAQTITGRWRSDSLQLLNGTNLTINGDLDVDRHTNLDNVNVSGATTCSGQTDFLNSINLNASTNNYIYFNDNLNFTRNGHGNEMMINSGGEVLIGTSTGTGHNLTVQDSGTSNTAGANIVARFQSNGSGRDATIQLSDNVAHSATISMLSSALILKQSGTETVHIDSSGRVMIGTSSAGLATGDEFTIHTSAHTGMTIRSGNSHEGNIFFGDSDYGSAGIVRYDHSANAMIFKTNSQGTDKLRINSNGDITTTGQASFSRQNAGFTARAGDSVTITRASGTPLEINRTGSDGQMISLFDDNSQEAGIGLSSGSLIIGLPNSSNPKLTLSSSNVSVHSTVGHFLVGTDSARSINSHNGRVQVTGTTFSHSTVSIISNTDSNNGAYLFLGKQRSGAVGGSSAVLEHDLIGELRFPAGDGTDMENYAARMIVHADANATSNNTPGRFDFYTTRRNGSSHFKARIHQNNNNGTLFSFGTETSKLNNSTNGDRTSFKIGPATHIEGVFGHNGTPGMYYNCYSGGNTNFYRGTETPSGGDWRPCAYGQKYGGHYFFGDTSTTGWNAQQQITTMQTNMQITSQGYVLKPAHPAFQVRRTNSVSATQNPLVYDTEYLNTGSHYKSSGTDAGKFVAPIAGVYFFYWTAIKNALNGQVTRLYINKNGGRIYGSLHLRLQEDGNYANGSTQATVYLAAGDKVHIELAAGAVHGSEYTQFGGYLIG